MFPSTAATHTVESCYVNSDNTLSNPTTKTMTCEALELNPVLKAQVETVSGHKVGYLFYTRFDGGYDQELLDELKQFKQEDITTWSLTCAITWVGMSCRPTCSPPASPAQPARGKRLLSTASTTPA